jgi:hypothetical protein
MVSAILGAIELAVLFIVLGIAWKTWSPWPSVPIADRDTWGYLSPALTWLSGLGFRQVDGRDWLYPAMVALFLKSTGSFAGIVAWQKALALLSGIVMALVWRCWVSMLPFHRWILFGLSLLGAWPIYLQLVNQPNILFTFTIRPEAVLPVFVYAQLACLLGFCKYRWHPPWPLPSLLLGASALVLAYACLVLKPSWYLAFALTSAPVFLGILGGSVPLKTRIGTPILGCVLAVLFLWLPPRFFLIKDRTSRTLLPVALFAVHAPLIEESLEAKLAALPDSDPEKARLRTFLGVLNVELENSRNAPGRCARLGIDPDYLIYESSLPAAIHADAGNGVEQFRAFCIGSFLGAVRYDSGAYAWKVFTQLSYFLSPPRETFVKDRINLAKSYGESAACWREAGAVILGSDVRAMYEQYRKSIEAARASAGILPKHRALRDFGRRVAAWAVPVESLFLLALAACLVWRPLHRLRVGGWAALCLYLAPLGNALGVSLVHSLDFDRYRATYAGYYLFALTAMVIFVAGVLALTVAHLISSAAPGSAAIRCRQ